MDNNQNLTNRSISIYVVSGGVGASGEQLVHTVLAQFPESRVRVITVPNVRRLTQVDQVIDRARQHSGVIVHTLVEADLRDYLVREASKQRVTAIDLMGPLTEFLQSATGKAALGQPGLYRRLNRTYFERVAAIEYTMAHDDGKDPENWVAADAVITGVSRAGKTPLSLYLSVLGWKVANAPIVFGIEPSSLLFRLNREQVIGLDIEAGQLLLLRQQRQRRLGAPGPTPYTDPQKVMEELEYARQIFARGGFTVLDVTDKPVESIADEVIRLLSQRI